MGKTLPYARHSISEADIEAVVSVLRSDHLTQGPIVPAFESAICEYIGVKHAVCVNSGTAALMLAYKAAIDDPDDDDIVVTSPLSFVATANAALMAGASVQFSDVDRATGNMEATDVGYDWVVPVHYAGRAAPIKARKDYVIEDAAQAFGAMDFDGCSKVGSCAHSLASCFSFHASKPLQTGEGGCVTTNDQGFADEVRSLRDHGRKDGLCVSLSGNFRMGEMAAALGLSQLRRVDVQREARYLRALSYQEKLSDVDVTQPTFGGYSAWHLYPIRVKNYKRDVVLNRMRAAGIGVQVHYRPITEQPLYSDRFDYHDFPESHAWGQVKLTPLHAGMVESDVVRVVDALREALA